VELDTSGKYHIALPFLLRYVMYDMRFLVLMGNCASLSLSLNILTCSSFFPDGSLVLIITWYIKKRVSVGKYIAD